MYIGELAKCSGATPKAIRLYEAMGLLGEVGRQGAYRTYSAAHVDQVRLIKRAQALGFRLADVAPAMQDGGVEPNWALLAEQVELRRQKVASEIERLQRLDVTLQEINTEIQVCARLA